MRIIVCVKQVYDPKTVKISRSREELDLRDAQHIFNPADKYALEAGLRLRELLGGQVLALTVGGAAADDVAREAVAIGADQAILVTTSDPLGGRAVTALIAAALARLGLVDLVLTGAAGATDGAGSLAPRLAAALGWPVLLDAVQLNADAGGLTAVIAQGDAAVSAPVAAPAVVAVAPGPERPRYPHPARIANAWDPGLVETWPAAELGVDADALAADVEPGGLILGPERVRGQVLGGTAAEAAEKLVGILRGKRIV